MPVYPSSTEAESAFYQAFADCSVSDMHAVWADDDVLCIHPGSDLIAGKEAVMQSWARILSGGASAEISFERISFNQYQDIAVHVVYEHLVTDRTKPPVTVIATNIYQNTNAGWRLIEHHGSQPVYRAAPEPTADPATRTLQ